MTIRGSCLSRIAIQYLVHTAILLVFGNAALNAQEQPGAVLNKYCVTCHNEKLNTAGLKLDRISVENVREDAPVWEKVVTKLRTGAMPPPGAARPSDSDYNSTATYLETELNRLAAENPNPGRPVIHRLNRAEYTNAVRDLLGIDTDAIDIAQLLPADESAQGFDNIDTALSVSPLLMERYLSATPKIVRFAIGDSSVRPAFETHSLPRFLMQDHDRMSEDLPFGSRGGTAVPHYFPVEGDYMIQVRLQRMARESIRGLHDESHQMDILVDGQSMKRFKVGGEDKGPFEYFKSVNIKDAAEEEYERTADKDLEVRVHLTAGTHIVAATFLKKAPLPEGPLQDRLTQIEYAQFTGGVPGIGEIIVGGPYDTRGIGDTPTRRKIFICRPSASSEEEACATRILSTLAHRAYRRPLKDNDVAVLLQFYRNGRSKGDFEAGIGAALERMLLDPEFLFHIERDPAGVKPNTTYRLTDIELASRLSFFLWSSIPDNELLGLAEQGRLKDPAVLEQQVRRMLADSRSTAFTKNFAGQWLLLRNLPSLNPDPQVFPYFDDNLREAFHTETELFVNSLVREDRGLMDLLNADYTFLNERLAKHYGIPNVSGSRFRRVTLSDANRRGLLGQGSVLMATSYPNRTAPTLRGKWIMENILGTPPSPPPPNVPALADNPKGKVLTMRERMEQHRANPACATCHKLMDPLGFALENYDAIGRWRTNEGDSAIDSSGALPTGEKFSGAAELRQLLQTKREQFVATVTERLLTYALGREIEYYDAPVIRKIMREAAPADYRWSSIILNIVKSMPFQMRRSLPS